MRKTNFLEQPAVQADGKCSGWRCYRAGAQFDGWQCIFKGTILNIVVTLKYILNQIINFCIPLIIIAFIAPSITQMGKNASKLLLIAVTIAYSSSVGAALFSTLRRICADTTFVNFIYSGWIEGTACGSV